MMLKTNLNGQEMKPQRSGRWRLRENAFIGYHVTKEAAL